MFIYDAIATNQSETIFEELEKFMHGRLRVEKTKDPNNKVPLAVIYDPQKDFGSLLEGLKGSQSSDPILFCLCAHPDVARKATEFEEIYIDISDKERYFVTFDIGQKLIDFVRLSYIQNKKNNIKQLEEDGHSPQLTFEMKTFKTYDMKDVCETTEFSINR